MQGPATTAIVVSYNARNHLPATMKSLRPAHDSGDLDCIVVDNASLDGTVQYLNEEHPWALVISNDRNLGFARACNIALSRVNSPYVLFLNPDAELHPRHLSTLVRFLDEHPRAGAAAPAIRDGMGGLQATRPLPTPLGLLRAAFGICPPKATPIEPGEKPFRTEWLCGAVLLFRKELLDQLGGFDPRFFLYYEETDLCRRALERGAELWAVGEAVAAHQVGAIARSTGAPLFHGCIAQHLFESRFYYLVKHFGWACAALVELLELPPMALRAGLARLRGKEDQRFRTRVQAPLLTPPRIQA